MFKKRKKFSSLLVCLRPPKNFVNGPLEPVGHWLAHSLSRSRLEQAGQPAFSYKNNANFMRQQGMGQASPVKAGQPGNQAGSPPINSP